MGHKTLTFWYFLATVPSALEKWANGAYLPTYIGVVENQASSFLRFQINLSCVIKVVSILCFTKILVKLMQKIWYVLCRLELEF